MTRTKPTRQARLPFTSSAPPIPNLPGIFYTHTKPTRHGTLHTYQTYPAWIYSPLPNLPGIFLKTLPNLPGMEFLDTYQTYPAYFRNIPNLPGMDEKPTYSGWMLASCMRKLFPTYHC